MNLSRRILGLLFLIVLNLSSSAQTISAEWSERIKSISGTVKQYTYEKSLQATDGEFVSAYISHASPDLKLVKYNSKLEFKKDLLYNLNNSLFGRVWTNYGDFVKIDNHFFLVLVQLINKEHVKNIFFQEIEVKDLKLLGDVKKVASFDLSESDGDSQIGYDYSFDSSKLLIYNEPVLKKKNVKFIQLVVVNKKLDKIVESKFDFGQPYKQVLISNIDIDNDGKIYISHNIYEKDIEKEYISSDGDKIPSYTSYLSVVDLKNKPERYTINNQGKFIQQLCMAYDINREIVFTGLYKELHNGRISGVFKGKFDKANPAINIKLTPFEEELLELVDKDGMGKSSGKKKGIDNDFIVRNITCINDGVIHMVAEYEYGDLWGDLLVATFTADGKVQTTRVPKNQHVEGIGAAYTWKIAKGFGFSFSSTYFDGKLLLFYNDNAGNAERAIEKKAAQMKDPESSSFVFAELSHDGSLIKREEIFSHKGMGKYVTTLNICSLSENKLVLFGLKSGVFTDAIKMGILTIK